MNFFEQQRAARGTTLRLVLLFATAVFAIVVAVDAVVFVVNRPRSLSSLAGLLIFVTVVTVLIITGGTVSKTIALRSGGSAVALSVGAVPVDLTTSDPNLRRYVNVVQEMSLAAGVPVPRLFVLESEPGINAFAAGFTTADAAITVTGGALAQLNRDELQGVIGHEFSHILNGDMRLNIRLIGLLNGILLLGLVGLRVLAFGGGGRSNDRGGGASPILLVALAMLILGFVGQFFAGLIKAAVSRQREWLADASSVQFTRQTTGLEGALKKIAGLPTGSTLRDARSAQEVSHMLFGEGGRSFSQLFATHPPLLKRIAALDPAFQPAQIAGLEEKWAQQPPDGLAEDAQRGFAATPLTAQAAPPRPGSARVTPAQVSARVGTLTPQDLDHGAAVAASLPPRVRQLAGQPSTAVPILLALLIDDDPQVRAAQLATVSSAFGAATATATEALLTDVASLPELLRLPVVSIAMPVVVARPREQLQRLLTVLDALAQADGRITVLEYCLTRLVAGYVVDATSPARRAQPGRRDLAGTGDAAVAVLAALAAAGNTDPAKAEHAFTTAVAHLFPTSKVAYAPPAVLPALDAAWPVLDALDPRTKQRFVEAMVAAVLDDGVLAPAEAELVRTACALLHCPLPALLDPAASRSL
ncbi:MAG TPA: M48 family metalloprotease [Jatrophihabitantaceae bacterium]